jgi:hypothetical protein
MSFLKLPLYHGRKSTQKKIAGILQGDISQVLQDKMRENAVKTCL